MGFVAVALFGAYDTLLDLELMAPINQVTNAYYFGLAGMLGQCPSISLGILPAPRASFLSRSGARMNRRRLGASWKPTMSRKTQELKDARQLQLSLLPPCQNDIPGIDICFHMETASEVGGDYYDYRAAGGRRA